MATPVKRVLIIEDDMAFAKLVEGFVKKHGYDPVPVHKIKDGIQQLLSETFQLVLLDFRLPDGTGFDVLEAMQQAGLSIPVIIMTSFHDIRTAVRTMRSGAFDYVTKPVNPEELLMVMTEALQSQPNAPAHTVDLPAQYVVGGSEAAKQLYDYLQLVAPTEMTVLLQGDSGTGKEQAARVIHQLSRRADKPFVAIDCGALSKDLAASELFGHVKGAFTGALQDKKGQFEAASGGTLFLDEVGNLGYEVQVKLLRALQEREIQPVGGNRSVKVDVRIVTATNDDLLQSLARGGFREDLYHRINEFKIKIPSLKQRREDLDEFVQVFLKQANKELQKQVTGVDEAVYDLLQRYDWPGNLRELKNILKRAVLLAKSPLLTRDTLPEEMVWEIVYGNKDAATPDLKQANALTEKELISKTLKEVKYNKTRAAKLLNIDRKTLYYKMSKYNIEG